MGENSMIIDLINCILLDLVLIYLIWEDRKIPVDDSSLYNREKIG
jgi:hypothetical protein